MSWKLVVDEHEVGAFNAIILIEFLIRRQELCFFRRKFSLAARNHFAEVIHQILMLIAIEGREQ